MFSLKLFLETERNIFEETPPGFENWIKKNKARFRKQYGAIGKKFYTLRLGACIIKELDLNESI